MARHPARPYVRDWPLHLVLGLLSVSCRVGYDLVELEIALDASSYVPSAGGLGMVDASDAANASDAADASNTDGSPNEIKGLVNRWALDGSATDGIGANHGVLISGATFQRDGVRGDVLSCNGVDAAVQIKNVATPNFTFAAWIWTDTPSHTGTTALDGDAIIYSNVPGSVEDFTLAVLNNRLSYISFNQTATGTKVLTDGRWHHIAVTRLDGGRVTLYVDAQVDGDGNAGSGLTSSNPNVFFCGNFDRGFYFKGLMDDVRLYDRELTPQEVNLLYMTTQR